MLPIQTVLALLMLLMAVGCSQKSPPRPGSTDLSATQTDDTRSVKPKPDPIIKPGPTNAPGDGVKLAEDKTDGSIEADGQWRVKVIGQGARRLFETTALQEIEGKKTGLQYECSHDDQNQYECSILLDEVDGTTKFLSTTEELKVGEAVFKPENEYTSSNALFPFVRIRPYSVESKLIDKEKNIWASASAVLNFVGPTAEKVFANLTKTKAQIDTPETSLGGFDYGTGIDKRGVNIQCIQRPLKSDPKMKHHWCTLYLGTLKGSVDLIVLPKAN